MGKIRIRCPQCGKTLTPMSAVSTVATVNVRRHCAGCRTYWSITVEPQRDTERFRIHRLTWTAYDPPTRMIE